MSLPATVTAEAIKALAQHPPKDDESRLKLYKAAQELMWAVELPVDTDHRIFFATAQTNLVRLASEMKIFDTLCSDPGKTWSIDDLAKPGAADSILAHRVCRYLNTIGVVTEVSEAEFQANHLTPQLATSGFKAGLVHYERLVDPCFRALPQFLRETGYRNPTDLDHTAFNKGLNFDGHAMQYLTANPTVAAAVFEYMAYHKKFAPSWFDGSVSTADFQLSEQDVQRGRVMMVDVGGGSGHQCLAARKAFPHLKGKMVVQEIPVMVDLIDAAEAAANDLEPMVHDFFTPQPVKGAKVYYLRTVLHDWPDERCKVILKHLRDAMVEDSVVVIDEGVVPKTGASFKQMTFDMSMMAVVSALERSEQQWSELLQEVGLKIRDIWIYDQDHHSGLIVAVPV